jgi:hypothetical protein
MGLFDYLLPGLAGLSGAVANRGGKTSSTNTSNPTLDPATADLKGNIINKTNTLLNEDPNLTGYQAQQTQQINKNSEIQRQKAIENLVSRGIDPNSPAGVAALNSVDSQRFGAITNLNEAIPLEATQMKQSILNSANQSFSTLPKGTSSTGTTTTPGNKLGGFVSGLAQTLAYLHGRGAFGKNPPPTTNGSSVNVPQLPDVWH